MNQQVVGYWQDGDSIFSVIWEKISLNQWAKVCGSEKLERKCQNKEEAERLLYQVRKRRPMAT